MPSCLPPATRFASFSIRRFARGLRGGAGVPRGRSDHARIAPPALSVVLAAGVALVTACSGSSPTSPSPGPTPGPGPITNLAPTISTMTVSQSAYRTGRVSAAASDPDGQVASGTVDWGDGTTTTLNGPTSVSSTHRYARAQAYSVTLRVLDDAGASAALTRSVSITVPPEACIGIEIIEVCATTTADFRNANIAAKAGDIVLARATISEGTPSVSLPLASGFGRLTVSHNFNTGRMTITGDVCPVPFLVCRAISSHTIQF
jgi:hypothetical protein